jgi:hypothetical protein
VLSTCRPRSAQAAAGVLRTGHPRAIIDARAPLGHSAGDQFPRTEQLIFEVVLVVHPGLPRPARPGVLRLPSLRPCSRRARKSGSSKKKKNGEKKPSPVAVGCAIRRAAPEHPVEYTGDPLGERPVYVLRLIPELSLNTRPPFEKWQSPGRGQHGAIQPRRGLPSQCKVGGSGALRRPAERGNSALHRPAELRGQVPDFDFSPRPPGLDFSGGARRSRSRVDFLQLPACAHIHSSFNPMGRS